MKLRPIGPNARVVETAAGAVLFSYEDLVAVKVGPVLYVRPGLVLTNATRAHLQRFAPAQKYHAPKTVEHFTAAVRTVLNAVVVV